MFLDRDRDGFFVFFVGVILLRVAAAVYLLAHLLVAAAPVTRTVNGTGHTGPLTVRVTIPSPWRKFSPFPVEDLTRWRRGVAADQEWTACGKGRGGGPGAV